jgi:hypothetical protein
MSKNNVDYSNTIIYKIYCKDKNINDVYVGHTTNFQARKYQHKLACKNSNCCLKIYKIIRENGGWNNWDMEEIARYNCYNLEEAKIKEQKHYEELNATLNSCPPYVDNKKYYCKTCNKQCSGPTMYNNHIISKSHVKKNDLITNTDNKCRFICEHCNINTNNKKDYNKHLLTSKHLNIINNINAETIKPLKIEKPKRIYSCKNCNVNYYSRVGLWKHKKKCSIKHDNECIYQGINIKDKDALLFFLLKQNNELQNKLIELNSHK